jgi:hypothetical protein
MRYPASKYGLSAVRLPNQIHPGTNVMDRTEMRKIQVAFGNRFARPRVGNLGFEIVEFALIAQTQLVNEDRRIFVGVRIVGRIIYASTTQSLRWARTIARRYSSGERPLLLASAARFFMAGFNRIPSTALIFAKPAWPRTKPVLLFLPVERFCFGMFGIYHIFSCLPRYPDEGGPPGMRPKGPRSTQTVDAIPAIAKLPYWAKREEAA